MTVKQRLHELVDGMTEEEATALLDDLDWSPPELTAEDRAAIDRGRGQAREGLSRPTDEVFERLQADA